jgi:hypothetical protein
MKITKGIIGLAVAGVAAAGLWQLREPAPPGWSLSSIDQAPVPTRAVEPTAAGRPSELFAPEAGAGLQTDDTGSPGSSPRGRVSRMFYRTHDNIYLAAEYTPTLQRVPERLYAEVEYPDRLKSGALSVLTRVDQKFGDVRPGDVVDVRIAHKHDSKNFPVRETTRVTALVARSDSALAQAFEARIVARKGGDTALAAAPGSQSLSQALGTQGMASR